MTNEDKGLLSDENKDLLSEHDAIARRAHELFVERGGEHGFHEADWLQAEAELRSPAQADEPDSKKPAA